MSDWKTPNDEERACAQRHGVNPDYVVVNRAVTDYIHLLCTVTRKEIIEKRETYGTQKGKPGAR